MRSGTHDGFDDTHVSRMTGPQPLSQAGTDESEDTILAKPTAKSPGIGAAKRKTAAPKPSPELAPTPAAPPPTLVPQAESVVAGPEMRKKQLIDRIMAEVPDARKKDAKPIIEATLAVLGQALTDGETLNLQPLGKMKVQKRKVLSNGQSLTLRLRRSIQSLEETEPLAETRGDG